jgi:pimeloyl-ACP methyl ester carboxylesterase
VVPVIVVPGIMGTNLRAKTDPKKRNAVLKPGEKAWRPPNGKIEGLSAAYMWQNRQARMRQLILDPETLEVDSGGEINLPLEARNYGMLEKEVRDHSWGEVHWDSYGSLLFGLYVGLNRTFEVNPTNNTRMVCRHWKDVMACDPARWGVRAIEKITEQELEKHAEYYYPIYAFGYNWLESCKESATKLCDRIDKIVEFWNAPGRECKKVILVTHSMGGLVARACAKQQSGKILGIIHGVMPALGAPAAYRRIACGTESWNPSNSAPADVEAGFVAQILGDKPELTMPVMASAPGPLQLLPNHLYPRPWLHVCMFSRVNNKDVARDIVHMPTGNPYDLYRDMDAWYRMVDPKLCDPANTLKRGKRGARDAIWGAIDMAERFHRETLDAYYHPNTYAFYGADRAYMSFGSIRWIARDPGNGAVFTEANLRGAALAGYRETVGRRIRVEGKTTLDVVPALQDVGGDGTVPPQSGAGPRGKVKQLFEIRGIDHQGAFNNESILLLTQHLVVKLVQELT